MLIIPGLPLPPLILKGNRRKSTPPVPLLRFALAEGDLPHLIRRWIPVNIPLLARLHIHLINRSPVGGIRKSCLQLLRIFLRLPQPLRILRIPSFGFDHRQFLIAIHQHIIRNIRFRPLPRPLQSSKRDHLLTNSAVLHHPPTRRLNRRVNQLRPRFRFVHDDCSRDLRLSTLIAVFGLSQPFLDRNIPEAELAIMHSLCPNRDIPGVPS